MHLKLFTNSTRATKLFALAIKLACNSQKPSVHVCACVVLACVCNNFSLCVSCWHSCVFYSPLFPVYFSLLVRFFFFVFVFAFLWQTLYDFFIFISCTFWGGNASSLKYFLSYFLRLSQPLSLSGRATLCGIVHKLIKNVAKVSRLMLANKYC